MLMALLLAMGLSGCAASATPSSATSESDAATPSSATSESDAANQAAADSTADGSDASDSPGVTLETPTTAVGEGTLAPGFSYTTVDGAKGSLSELKGKVVLLNLWASWCGPCVREMPDIAKLKENYPTLEVLAVNVSDDPTAARSFIEEANYDFNWVLDEQGTIGALYPSTGIPYTIIIDTEGVIGKIFLGSPPDVYGTYEQALKQAGL
jgi:thiol-disulfide isomerase/thioredoxin